MTADRRRGRERSDEGSTWRERPGSGVGDRSADRRRGQSEVVGYVAVFTIVVLLVSVSMTAGYTQLQEVRSFEQGNGATRTVERFAAEVETLLRDDSRQRSVEIDLGEGSLSGGEPTNVTVSGHAVGEPSQNFSRSFTLRTLEFQVADTRIRYVSGAVLRVEEDGAVMVRGPPGVFSRNQTVVPLVDTELRNGGIGGDSQVALTARRPRNGTDLVASTTEPYELTITVETAHPDVWERTLEAELDTSCSQSGDTVTCSYTTDRLSVVAYRIDVTHAG